MESTSTGRVAQDARQGRRMGRRVLAGVLLVLVLLIIGGVFYLRQSLPKTTGAIEVSGLDGPVEIVRDADGVAHIFAGTDHDAFFTLGYVHAQDRLWQMEFQRRVGAGRLSEILGETTLPVDKFLRTLGPYRAAETVWPALSQDSQVALQAYADGVNAYLAEGHILPLEFQLLGVKPEPWRVTDSLVWAKMMAWDLGGNYEMELLRTRLTQAIGPERTAQILPAYPQSGTTILAGRLIAPQTVDGLLSMAGVLQTDLQLGGLNVGSNNWVIDGNRTKSGLPLLANDPHLGAQIPSLWYLAELQGDSLHVIGATLPGLPAVVIGRNDHIAWGVTNLAPDVQDLYIERINPQNLNQYEVEGEWVDLTIIEEPIFVKGEEEPILWAARSTRHGPLISDVSGSVPYPMALRWTALDSGDTTVDGFTRLNYATNWEDFVAAMALYIVPSQNFVYADRAGNIGYYGPGHIPIRAAGDGMMPVPGWNSEYEWTGWIPFAALPQAFKPQAGYIATANNRVVADDYPYFITNDWSPPYRAERIVELIEGIGRDGQKISMADMITIQSDQFSTQARQLLPHLQRIGPKDDRQAQALAYLAEWNGLSGQDSVATTIYQAWFLHLGRAMFEDDLRGSLYEDFAERQHPVFLANLLANPDNIWCDNFLTTPLESCQETARVALDKALDELEERLGSNMATWQWGKVHQTQYPHNPLSEVPALKWLFHRSIPNGGDAYSPNVAPIRMSDLYQQYNLPSYRHIIDLSAPNDSLYMHTTGQSGNLLSPHYADLIERHRDVDYLQMSAGRENVNGDLLRLEPP